MGVLPVRRAGSEPARAVRGDNPRVGGDATQAFDVAGVRADIPMLAEPGDGARLIYLDNAATTLKPRAVIDAVAHAQAHELSSVRRGASRLAQRADDAYEAARARVARFLNASSDEVVFVRGATEALNLIAECWARPRVGPGDELLVTELEHHANLLPWQRVASQTGARLVLAPVAASGAFDREAFSAHLSSATRLVACTHVSNVLGIQLPVRELAAEVRARAPRAALVVDGAQAVAHLPVDVGALDCDFYVFSGHKLYGPSGIGVLFGRREHLREMPPYQVGGGMVSRVDGSGARFVEPPHRFEAGTPNVAGALGLAAAIDYVCRMDRVALARHEAELIACAARALSELTGGVRLLGLPESGALLSFALDGLHPHDVATVLDARGVAVRAGHHCAQPLMRRLALPGTVRLSVAAYNGFDDIEALACAVRHARELLS